MNKTELIAAIAAKTGATKKTTGEFVDAFVTAVTETLTAGNDVALTGFGKFVVSEVAERTARNPQDGSEIVVPAHNRASFKVGKALKDAVK